MRWRRSETRAAKRACLFGVAAVLLCGPTTIAAGDDTEKGVAVFRDRVEPLLKKRCFECHSHEAGEASGGLMLDSRAGWEAGGDSGPAVEPGDPEKSRLVRAVEYGDPDLQMPPDGKLPEADIAVFTEWVRRGAIDPRAGTARSRKEIDLAEGRKFWCYRPVADPPPHAVQDAAWPSNEIDRFILAGLEVKGFRPAPDADRSTLARRLYFDLTGLPPTPEQIDGFIRDADPNAYEKLVDRLLASRAFGERWARHWFDVARFAESVTLRGLIFKEAWRYRDYTIAAFNDDVPFDRFLREQIAGDLLPAATPDDRVRQLVATTYLQLGNTNLEEQDKVQLRMDVVDEQLDVIGKGILATTVTCARCHDHKFDPIPTKDYYALAGILRNVQALRDANVSSWIEVPLPAPPAVEAAAKAHREAVAALEGRLKAAKAKASGGPASAGVLATTDVPGVVVDDTAAQKVGQWKNSVYSGTYVGAGYVHDENAGKGEKTLIFEPQLPASGEYEVWLAYSPGGSRSDRVPVSVFGLDGEKVVSVDMKPAPPIGGRLLSLGRYRFEKDGQCFVLISTTDTTGHVTADAVTFIPIAEVAAATQKLAGAAKDSTATDDVAALEAELKKLRAAAPKRPMAMSVIEEPKVEEIRVHVRGSVHNLGDIAPRGFLSAAAYGPAGRAAMPADQSGRLQLADWLASRDNPLTARVFVNRAWHWLFGAGIVRTVDNFGTTGEAPSHPELLDHLASRFVEEGWSVKRLVRRIVLSRTYRQSATGEPAAVAADPENRLFGRANVRRLDAECLRDTMLQVGGTLADFPGGPSFPESLSADYGFRSNAPIRSVYLPVFRNALPELFEVFDFADPSTVTGRRNTSAVPQQALFLTNNPFAVHQARLAAKRLLGDVDGNEARVSRVYWLVLGREPSDAERRTIGAFLATWGDDAETAWSLVFQALFASPEFRHL
jgi:hypothetical protein